MLRWLYNLVLLLFSLFALPKLLWGLWRHKKYRRSLGERLGKKIDDIEPSLGKKPRIWVHAVSMGETKAVAPLIKKIREEFPEAALFFSSTTETGHDEAKRLFPGLDGYLFLPIDFSWVIRRFVGRVKPDLLILSESDFWYNLMHAVPLVVLVNGKISLRSYRRFFFFRFFAKRLFAPLRLLAVQSERYGIRFQKLGVSPEKIVVSGNLKFDQPIVPIDKREWRQKLNIGPSDPVIVLGSTHAPEEEEVLDALGHLTARFAGLKIIIVPRHPERFDAVAGLLEKKGIAYARFSRIADAKGFEHIILMDAMGLLSLCYQIAHVAIVGGSFSSLVGGHNIFEPAALGVPVLFGPHMESQKDLVDLVVSAGAGVQVELKDLESVVARLLENEPAAMKEAGRRLAAEVYGATDRTWKALRPFITNLAKYTAIG